MLKTTRRNDHIRKDLVAFWVRAGDIILLLIDFYGIQSSSLKVLLDQ